MSAPASATEIARVARMLRVMARLRSVVVTNDDRDDVCALYDAADRLEAVSARLRGRRKGAA